MKLLHPEDLSHVGNHYAKVKKMEESIRRKGSMGKC